MLNLSSKHRKQVFTITTTTPAPVQKKFHVLTGPGCVACRATLRALHKHGATYETTSITDDPGAADTARAGGYMSLPVVTVLQHNPTATTPETEWGVVAVWEGFRNELIKTHATAQPDPNHTTQAVVAA